MIYVSSGINRKRHAITLVKISWLLKIRSSTLALQFLHELIWVNSQKDSASTKRYDLTLMLITTLLVIGVLSLPLSNLSLPQYR